MRTIPLLVAYLKEFFRNWKSITLLLVLPLLLIGGVFLSFSPTGLQKTPLGIVVTDQALPSQTIESLIGSYAYLTYYAELDECLSEVKAYRLYGCITIRKESAYVLTLHFDNTREPVIWEIVQRVQVSADLLKKTESKAMAEGVLERLKSKIEDVETYRQGLNTSGKQLESFLEYAENASVKLDDARDQLDTALVDMDTDIRDVRQKKQYLDSHKDNFYYTSVNHMSTIDNHISVIVFDRSLYGSDMDIAKDRVEDMKNDLDRYYNDAEGYIGEMDSKLDRYQSTSAMGRSYISVIEDSLDSINKSRTSVQAFRMNLSVAESELGAVESDMEDIRSIDPELLVNPVVLRNSPIYVPQVSEDAKFRDIVADEEAISQGLNLISLQTLFPSILLIITMFLALLVSSYLCLKQINSEANTRLRLINGISIHEFISVLAGSLLIIILPVFLIILVGQTFFHIPLIDKLPEISLILILLSAVMCVMGLLLSYLVKKESIAMLVSTFLLVFLLFFSGFLLPVERMSTFAAGIAEVFPGRLAQVAFSKIAFYSQPLSAVFDEIFLLTIWIALLTPMALLGKKLRNA